MLWFDEYSIAVGSKLANNVVEQGCGVLFEDRVRDYVPWPSRVEDAEPECRRIPE
jgi:hypothetical protein